MRNKDNTNETIDAQRRTATEELLYSRKTSVGLKPVSFIQKLSLNSDANPQLIFSEKYVLENSKKSSAAIEAITLRVKEIPGK